MGLFSRSKLKKCQKAYEAKMAKAMQAQRSGDIQGFAALNEEADTLLAEVRKLEEAPS